MKFVTYIHKLNRQLAKAVRAHQAYFAEDPAGLEAFTTSHVEDS